MMLRISYVVVTGFLGAGKTTLLRRLVHSDFAAARRIAFIVNDLAEVDVDGRLLESEVGVGGTVIRLSSGCICCTIRGEFEAAVHQIIEAHQPDMLVVESSGVTNPQAVLHGLHHPRLRLDSVITVIDAERFLEYMRYSAAVETQVYMADFVLLNKRELVTPEQLAQVEAQVRRFNRKCAIIPTSYADVPPQVLFGAHAAHAERDLAAPDDHAGAHDHLRRDEIESVTLPAPDLLDEGKLADFLRSEAVRDVYRAKGFVQMAGDAGPSLFNFVPRRFGLERLPTEIAGGRRFIQFIGRNLKQHEDALRAGLAACAL
ncbi:MAG: GTP-binding protein [Anaerolineae bacterium]|nr:GTP-binding protein [Candidatus Roseilinea sp.]MDW8451540.1 GTP-binding protein [Anaerolineae bacterium]